jgi:4-alpha-glucanotransferase
MKLFDLVRIDHFRAFADYYAIPAEEETAVNGEWEWGPGMEFFNILQERLGKVNIVAEDLGMLTPAVGELLADSGFPGMKVLQFAFDGDDNNLYQPHNYIRNCVVYIGTHDNDTLCGWLGEASEKTMTRLKKYLRAYEGESLSEKIISAAMASVADTVIITVQDLLGLGREARMNTPSTKQSNWTFRAEKDYLEKIDKDFLKEITEIYFR